MKKTFSIEIEEEIIDKFGMALKLAGGEEGKVIEDFMKEYITLQFSKVVTSIRTSSNLSIGGSAVSHDTEYGKAISKIPKWANKQTQIPYRIIRAYLQIKEKSSHVTLVELESRCSDEINHADVFVKNFNTNFAQMKLDSEKSHGKVFEVREIEKESYVYLWNHIESEVISWKAKFLELHSTDTGYINDLNQKNMGKTDRKGTGYGQMLYKMECLDCHYIYYANGHDIFLKRCPSCQGGADTGNE